MWVSMCDSQTTSIVFGGYSCSSLLLYDLMNLMTETGTTSSTVPNHNGSRYMRLPYIDSRALVENVNSSYILQFDRKSENFYYLYL